MRLGHVVCVVLRNGSMWVILVLALIYLFLRLVWMLFMLIRLVLLVMVWRRVVSVVLRLAALVAMQKELGAWPMTVTMVGVFVLKWCLCSLSGGAWGRRMGWMLTSDLTRFTASVGSAGVGRKDGGTIDL